MDNRIEDTRHKAPMDQSGNVGASVNSPASINTLGEPEVKTITEKELIENFENEAVKSLVIDQVKSGYVLHVTLTWRKDGPLLLVKYRSNEARLWKNLDRLAKYLQELPNVPPLVVRMLPPSEKKTEHDRDPHKDTSKT